MSDTTKMVTKEMADRQRMMFGSTADELLANVSVWRNIEDPLDLMEAATSILSDSQEQTVRGHLEDSRRSVNCAKFLIARARDLIRK